MAEGLSSLSHQRHTNTNTVPNLHLNKNLQFSHYFGYKQWYLPVHSNLPAFSISRMPVFSILSMLAGFTTHWRHNAGARQTDFVENMSRMSFDPIYPANFAFGACNGACVPTLESPYPTGG